MKPEDIKHIKTIVSSILGVDASRAREYVESFGYVFRLTREDGSNYMLTQDRRSDRINVELDNGIVTSASIY